jgi:hypothetical protein
MSVNGPTNNGDHDVTQTTCECLRDFNDAHGAVIHALRAICSAALFSNHDWKPCSAQRVPQSVLS